MARSSTNQSRGSRTKVNKPKRRTSAKVGVNALAEHTGYPLWMTSKSAGAKRYRAYRDEIAYKELGHIRHQYQDVHKAAIQAYVRADMILDARGYYWKPPTDPAGK